MKSFFFTRDPPLECSPGIIAETRFLTETRNKSFYAAPRVRSYGARAGSASRIGGAARRAARVARDD